MRRPAFDRIRSASRPMRDRRRGLRIVAIAAAWLVLTALPAQARPPHKKALADYLGPGLARKLNDCRTCHLVPEPGADDVGGSAAQRVRQAAQGGARRSSGRPASPRASRRGSRPSPARTATATASPTCSSWSPATSPARPTTGRPPPSWPGAARPSPRSSGRRAGIRGTRSSGSIARRSRSSGAPGLRSATRSMPSSPPSTPRAA